jgi:probable HAF family extracellular repeat protein
MRKLFTLIFMIAFLKGLALAQVYQPIILSSSNYLRESAFGINDSGMIAGACALDFSAYHACYWQPNNNVTDLGTLGGLTSLASAVNNLGQIVGSSDTPDGQRVFLWTQASGMQALPSLGSGKYEDGAAAINNNGAVVGFSCLSSSQGCFGPNHAFLWTSSGGIQDLGTLPGDTDSSASGINSVGHVVGQSFLVGGTQRAFIWTPTTGMQELAHASGLHAYWANAISDNDEVVGTFVNAVDKRQHAFLWTQTTGIQDLGVLPNGASSATAIDKAGTSTVGAGGAAHRNSYGLIWRSGTILKLDTLAGIHLGLGAIGINSSGQIIANQANNAVLLNPSWVKLSARSFNFQSVKVGQSSAAKSLIITNIGSTTLTMNSVFITGANAGDFSQTNNCGSKLAPGAHCVVHVTFTPTAMGTRNGNAVLSDSDSTSPQLISLTGTGT